MTMLFIDGFESYGDLTTAKADIIARLETTPDMDLFKNGAADGVQIVAGETQGFALDIPPQSSNDEFLVAYGYPSAYRVNSNLVSEFAVGFRYYNGELDEPSDLSLERVIWYNTVGSSLPGSIAAKLFVDNASSNTDLKFTDTNNDTTTASNVLTNNAWHYIELEYKPSSSNVDGYMIVYVDGTEVMNTSAEFAAFAFFKALGFMIGSAMNPSGDNDGPTAQGPKFDDLYCLEIDGVDHTGRLGDSQVILLQPNQDGTVSDWAPDSGTDNFDRVEGTDWDETTYVEAATNGDDDHYEYETFSASGGTVNAVQIDVVCEATDGTPNLHIGFDNGTADEVDLGVIASADGVHQERALFQEDPSGSNWTESSVNANEVTQRMTE